MKPLDRLPFGTGFPDADQGKREEEVNEFIKAGWKGTDYRLWQHKGCLYVGRREK